MTASQASYQYSYQLSGESAESRVTLQVEGAMGAWYEALRVRWRGSAARGRCLPARRPVDTNMNIIHCQGVSTYRGDGRWRGVRWVHPA
jgi:hypothetical protein